MHIFTRYKFDGIEYGRETKRKREERRSRGRGERKRESEKEKWEKKKTKEQKKDDAFFSVSSVKHTQTPKSHFIENANRFKRPKRAKKHEGTTQEKEEKKKRKERNGIRHENESV